MSTVPVVRPAEQSILPDPAAEPRPPFLPGTEVEIRGSSFLKGRVQSSEGEMVKVLLSLPLTDSQAVLHLAAESVRPISPTPCGDTITVSAERFHQLAFSAWLNGRVGDVERVRKQLRDPDSALFRAMDQTDREHADDQLDKAGDSLLRAHPSPDCSITTGELFDLLDGRENPAAHAAVAGVDEPGTAAGGKDGAA
jgi:hypothetical protein